MLAVHLSIILDNDQLDTHLLYFKIYLLHCTTCFEHYMLIIRRSNCIDASGTSLSVSNRPVHRLREGSLSHLLYFTISLLHSSTCFEHYMLIIRRLNCTDAAYGTSLSVSDRPVHRLREGSLSHLLYFTVYLLQSSTCF